MSNAPRQGAWIRRGRQRSRPRRAGVRAVAAPHSGRAPARPEQLRPTPCAAGREYVCHGQPAQARHWHPGPLLQPSGGKGLAGRRGSRCRHVPAGGQLSHPRRRPVGEQLVAGPPALCAAQLGAAAVCAWRRSRPPFASLKPPWAQAAPCDGPSGLPKPHTLSDRTLCPAPCPARLQKPQGTRLDAPARLSECALHPLSSPVSFFSSDERTCSACTCCALLAATRQRRPGLLHRSALSGLLQPPFKPISTVHRRHICLLCT